MDDKDTKIRTPGAARGVAPPEGPTAIRLQQPVGKLTIMNGRDLGKSHALHYTRVTVGRGTGNVLRLDTDDYTISKHENAIFETKGDKIVVVDGGGTNVILVNGKEAPGTTALKFGDLVVIGETTLRLDPA